MNLRLLTLILKYHAGQTRINSTTGKPDPIVEHLFRVLVRLLEPAPHYPENLLMVRLNALPIVVDAVLAHELLEDTSITPEELGESIHPYAMEAVVALTRSKETSYDDYIQKQILPNPVASLVKLGDLEDNMVSAKDSLKVRYAKAKDKIIQHWTENVLAPTSEKRKDAEAYLEKSRIITS